MKDAAHYLKVFVDYATAASTNDEIAACGPTILGKLIDHGEIPSSSGYYHDTICGRIDKMRRIHQDFKTGYWAIVEASKRDWQAVLAAVQWEYWLWRSPGEKRLTTGKDVAEHLDEEYVKFKNRRSKGMRLINAELGIFVA